MKKSLTFEELRQANFSRCLRWHPAGIHQWSHSDWAVALAGEVGELCNVIKKLNRVRDGLPGNTITPENLMRMVAEELGDVAAYLDLVATRFNLKLEDCIKEKFNVVSERNKFPERL